MNLENTKKRARLALLDRLHRAGVSDGVEAARLVAEVDAALTNAAGVPDRADIAPSTGEPREPGEDRAAEPSGPAPCPSVAGEPVKPADESVDLVVPHV